MTKLIRVNAGAIKDTEGKVIYDRVIEFQIPKVLLFESLSDLAKELGEDYLVHQIKNQMRITWRAKMRTAMEKKDDNGDYVYTDDQIMEKVYDQAWVPELRITKTPEEKALEALGALDPETRKLVIASMNKKKKA